MTRAQLTVAWLLLLPSSLTAMQTQAWTDTQREVWATVESRIDAWTNNDFNTYLNLHHDGWHRFSMSTAGLMSKDDVSGFWTAAKASEKVLRTELTPISIDVFGGGDVAIAHYIASETFEWIAETRRRSNGRLMELGETYYVPARFSDVYIRQNGEWLYIGGYRDLTCDVLPQSPNPCRP